MQEQIDYLTEENSQLVIEVNENKRRIQNLLEKSMLIEQKLEDQTIEAGMHKERVESMLEENRKLVTETAVLNKNIENFKQVQEVLEKQISNLEKELQTYTKMKVKSMVVEAEMH
jgi:chromosome segregation ATPase